MANQIFIFLFLWLCFLSLFTPIFAQSSETYIVHMDLSLMPKYFSSHHTWYSATLDSLSTAKKDATAPSASKLIYGYTHAIHGFSATLSPSELESIKNTPGYISSIKDATVKVDTSHSTQFLGLNSNSGAWPVSDYGNDIIIGLVDTGIWPESKSYIDEGMDEIPSRWKGECEVGTQFNSSLCNKKLIGARYFNKGLMARDPNLTISMNSTRDTDGHGTHTSSTAAGGYVQNADYFGYATGTARGTAPKARVAMYKAIWDEGAVLSDILAAIDQSILDGVDVLSMSLGVDGIPLYEDPIAIATFAALEKGIFVSTSAGNSGPYLQSLHNGTPWVLTVAAGTIDREFLGRLTLGNGVSLSGLALYPGKAITAQIPVVLNACENATDLNKFAHKIVVCSDNNNSLGDQYYQVRNSKVSGAVFITNITDLDFYVQSSFPAVLLSPGDGEIILDYIKNNTSQAKASLQFQETRLGTKPAPSVASYSSRGPSPSCPQVLKPDIMGPGSLILASWPDNLPAAVIGSDKKLYSNFELLSGTSMSCPHVSGVAALLKRAHPEWSSAAIRSALMTTSDSLDNTLKPIKDIGDDNKEASPLALGAGHINPNKALNPGLIYDMTSSDYINLLCGLNFTSNQIQTIVRTSSFSCSNASLDINYPSFIAYFVAKDNSSEGVTVQEFQRTVTYVGDGESTYTAKLTQLEGFKVKVVPETLVFKGKNEKKSYKLSIEGPGSREATVVVVHGSLSWIESQGKNVVKSPIVVTNLSSEPLLGQS